MPVRRREDLRLLQTGNDNMKERRRKTIEFALLSQGNHEDVEYLMKGYGSDKMDFLTQQRKKNFPRMKYYLGYSAPSHGSLKECSLVSKHMVYNYWPFGLIFLRTKAILMVTMSQSSALILFVVDK